MDNKVRTSTSQGLFWRSLEGVGSQCMNFIVQLVLARLLMPEDFGVVAILSIFINLANTFVLNGLGTALLRKKNATECDFCTVFYMEIGISMLMYLIIFILAPYIANLYNNTQIVEYLRVFSITIIIGAFCSIQTIVLRYRMDFRSSCIANFGGIIMQGVIGITFALLGFGVWSLILSQITCRFVTLLLLVAFVHWFPKFKFSFRVVKELFSYSWKLFVGWLIGTVYSDLFSLIIGKVYDETTLGYYTKGQSIPQVVNKTVTQVTSAVMFPALSKVQDKNEKLKKQTREMLSASALLIFPIMAGIAAAAEPLVMVILTEKWRSAIPIIQITCISLAINVVSNANMQSFNAIGRSDVFLRCEIIKRSITVILVLITAWVDFYLMLSTISLMGVFSLILNGYYNVKLLGYKTKEQCIDLLPYIGYAISLFILVFPLNFLSIGYALKLVLEIFECAIIYLLSICFIKKGAFSNVKTVLLQFVGKKLKKRNKTPTNEFEQIQKFIREIDKDFPVPISEKVDISDYSRKLCEKATIVTEIKENKIVAMAAGYTENTENQLAYVSILGTIKEYRGQGLANKLLSEFINISKQKELKGVHLYTAQTNECALSVYSKHGFTEYIVENESRPDDLHLVLYFEENK